MPKNIYKSSFLRILSERGFIYQCSSLEGLDELLSKKSGVKAYIGFDCTAKSLHIGSLIQIMMLRHFQQCGHIPVIVLGGGTTLIGDPTGRDTSRKMLTKEDITENELGIKKVFDKYLSFSGDNKAIFVNNADWLTKFSYLEFLRNYGTQFTINRMLTFDSVKSRLERENPLTFLEFNYMLLQAVDYLYLHDNYDVNLQMGGSDQWGNIINGIELVRKSKNKEVFGLTSHLLTKSDGSKMGKTATGAVWLNSDMFSAYDFYQYFRNVDDADTVKFLKLFTDLPLDEINKLATLKGREINEAKKILSFEVTKICHGEKEALDCQKMAINTFEKGIMDEKLPTFLYHIKNLEEGIPLTEILKDVGFASSNSDARRSIISGAIKINDDTISDTNVVINIGLFKEKSTPTLKLSFGKKKHVLLGTK